MLAGVFRVHAQVDQMMYPSSLSIIDIAVALDESNPHGRDYVKDHLCIAHAPRPLLDSGGESRNCPNEHSTLRSACNKRHPTGLCTVACLNDPHPSVPRSFRKSFHALQDEQAKGHTLLAERQPGRIRIQACRAPGASRDMSRDCASQFAI